MQTVIRIREPAPPRSSATKLERILLAAVAFALSSSVLMPRPAVACGNADRLERDDSVKRIAQIEFHLRYEQHWLADQALPAREDALDSETLAIRATDLKYALDVRWRKRDVARAVQWFRERASRKDPEKLAWLAEALIEYDAASEARTILRDLDKRDLIPDGRGYAALAGITRGDERLAALAKCRKRALVKSICGEAPRTT